MLHLHASLTVATLSSLAQQTPPPPTPPAQDPAGKTGWTGVLSEKEFAALHELKKGAAPKLFGKDILVGKTTAYLSLPKGGKPTAAVLVIHEWWGLNDHVKHWADRLAADGYAALAIDLYGGVVATTREAAMNAMQAVDSEAALATLRAAHAFLADDPRIQAKKRACIGWCFGGGWSLQLALAAPDLDAAVIYYGRLVDDPKKLAAIRAPILGVFGNKDNGIPPRSVEAFAAAMRKAGKSLELHQYDANHAFANPSSARYDAKNAAAAWKKVRAFLRTHLATAAREAGGFIAGTKPLQYDTPAGWRPAKNKSAMRLLTLATGKESECYVTVLSGNGGGVQANVNRWRQQMGESALSSAQIAALEQVAILGRKGPYARIDGPFGKHEAAVMLTAICELGDRSVFVKMAGPKNEMDGQEKAFKAFCASMR